MTVVDGVDGVVVVGDDDDGGATVVVVVVNGDTVAVVVAMDTGMTADAVGTVDVGGEVYM